MRPITILPMMILVAMLSFSWRFMEFYAGFSDLSGSAKAVEEVQETPILSPEPEVNVDEADEVEVGDGNSTSVAEDETQKWRDAGDDGLEVDTIKLEMYEDLVERRKELDVREQDLRTREALLTAAEMELDRKYQELNHLRHKIESLLEQQSVEEKARIDSLVTIYEGMKAKEAASIFNTLDLDVLVLIMADMSERKLSPILAKMNPERARTVTIMLAEQKKLPVLPQK